MRLTKSEYEHVWIQILTLERQARENNDEVSFNACEQLRQEMPEIKEVMKMEKDKLINEIERLHDKDEELREYRRLLHLISRDGTSDNVLDEVRAVLVKYGVGNNDTN